MSDESVELETHAEDGGGQVVEVHAGGQAEVMAEGPKAAKKGGRLRGLLRRLSSLSLFPRPQQGQQPRRSLSWRRKRRRKSEGAGKSPSSPLSSFRDLWRTSSQVGRFWHGLMLLDHFSFLLTQFYASCARIRFFPTSNRTET